MAISKSEFLTLFLLFSSLHIGFSSGEVVDNPVSQSEIVGQLLPYAQDCCNFQHTGNCGCSPTCCSGGDSCNPPCVQNGGGCVQNPSNRCCSGSGGQPSPGPWLGPCPPCGCVRSNVNVEGQLESDHSSSESMPSKH